MTTFTHRHPSVEALRLTIQNAEEVAKWCGGRVITSRSDGFWVMFTDVNGQSQTAVPSDFIVKYEAGKYARFTEPEFESEYFTLGHTESREFVLARLASSLGIEEALGDSYEAGHAEGFHMGRSTPEQGHKAQRQNREFHEAMGIESQATPSAIPADDVPVVIELIREEFIDELIPALGARVTFTPDGKFDNILVLGEPNVVEIYDALIDILYVTYGALNRAGMDAEPGSDEVQGSNMSKLGADGQPIIAGENDPDGVFPGRVKKGPNYYKPNLADVLREQGWDETEEQVA